MHADAHLTQTTMHSMLWLLSSSGHPQLLRPPSAFPRLSSFPLASQLHSASSQARTVMQTGNPLAFC